MSEIDCAVETDPKVRSASLQKKNNCQIMVANLFHQTVTKIEAEKTVSRMDVTNNNQIISASNHVLAVDISVLVTPNNQSGVNYLQGSDLYHSFYFTLNRASAEGSDSRIYGLSADDVKSKSTYKIDGVEHGLCNAVEISDFYVNVATTSEEDSETLLSKLKSEENGRKFEIQAHIEMPFDTEKLTEEFPERDENQEYGVGIAASTNLSYDSSTLAYSSMSVPYPSDDHSYYIESVKTAVLTYSAKKDDKELYDEIGFNSKNQTTLGVNGRSAQFAEVQRTSMPVNTEAFYNVQSLTNAVANAQNLKLVFALEKKTDYPAGSEGGERVEYKPVDMGDYLEDVIQFRCGEASATATPVGNSIVVMLDATKCNPQNSVYDIVITFNAKTGGNFKEYANYKVNLRAELVEVANSAADDVLVYTNAKINPDILTAIQQSAAAPNE
jgi:hypothetical protein